jgi:exopolysaccharide biosynthesis polyprenyl glycosylphosphotransferase
MTTLDPSPPVERASPESAFLEQVPLEQVPLEQTPLEEETAAAHPYSAEDIVSERTRDLNRKRRSGRTHRRDWMIKRALAAADVTGLVLAFLLAQLAIDSHAAGQPAAVAPVGEFLLFFLTLPLWLALARVYGLYDRDEARTDYSTVDDLFGLFNMLTVGMWVMFTVTWLTGVAHPTVPKLALFWGSAIVLVALARCVARGICRRTDAYVRNTVIVGAGHVGQSVARKLLQHPEYGVNLVGFVDDHPRERRGDLAELTVLGEVSDLPQLVGALDIERVIIAFSQVSHTQALAIIRELNGLDVQVDVVPRLFEVLGPQTTIHGAEGIPLLGLPPARLRWSSLVLKRAMDLTVSFVGLLVLSPALAIMALAIKFDSPGPVLFRQVRMGRGDRPFVILKFRTMTADADERKPEVAHLNKHSAGDDRMFKIPNDPRITRVGGVLRRFSLDEMPQLVNVLRGEMSLVGARPLIPDEHRYVDGWGMRRLDLKPGMTGLWQVLGRDDIPFGEMVSLDYRYVTTWSLWQDIQLIFRTFPAVARRRGESL